MPLNLPAGSTILVLGSGPIVIGQAAEFDYSGTQACKALRALGFRVVLLNSNPATVMTDPDVAHATYIEPLTVDTGRRIIACEKPVAVLPTVGGQVGLNLALDLHNAGVLDDYGVHLIGADPTAIALAEDRQAFKDAMVEIGVGVAQSGTAHTLDEALTVLAEVGLPAIVRPSFTLGGAGGGVAHTRADFETIVTEGLALSPTTQVLVEKSLLGWKEFELEVMRDHADNAIVVCSIENFDPMGVHTGDSITVAPAMTLTDREYQHLRDLALQILRRVGVETGGSNVQFAVNPDTGEVVVIELNPRVSRSSALASKATGFPIAKIAAQLAVGLTLDAIPNDITGVTPAAFEPVLDYVIVKIPRWSSEKFTATDRRLGTVMRSVGEVMGVGRTFTEALLKAIDSLEGGFPDVSSWTDLALEAELRAPTPDRLAALFEALRRGRTLSEVHALTHIDPWFLRGVVEILELETRLGTDELDEDLLLEAKQAGFSDARIAAQRGVSPDVVHDLRESFGLHPVYKRIDTCAGEMPSSTPTLYSTWEEEDEAGDTDTPSVVILGNGPNRIGQGLEFDHCCCHAAWAVREAGLTAVMVNCNPETVSTDYDTSDKLYFEPITAEHVRHVNRREQPLGVIVQFGGQTPLKLSHEVGTILGTQPDVIDLCEDRERFAAFLDGLGIAAPPSAIASTPEQAREFAVELGFPLLVRPSYVLGGRAMAICWTLADVDRAIDEALQASEVGGVLLDRYLVDAIELDVDALCDGKQAQVVGLVEHIEEAGVHSGDSSGVLPPVRTSDVVLGQIRDATERIAVALGIVGLVNVQIAVLDDQIYVLEVNPRASRTVPFVSKATGLALPALATRLCLGASLSDLDLKPHPAGYYHVKSPVFPWRRFTGTDVVLGPEMRSTGEVMGIGRTFGEAMAKSLLAAGTPLPLAGGVYVSAPASRKTELIGLAAALAHLGYVLHAPEPITSWFGRIPVVSVTEPELEAIDLICMLPDPDADPRGERDLRLRAVHQGIPCLTNAFAWRAMLPALRSLREDGLDPIALQDLGATAS